MTTRLLHLRWLWLTDTDESLPIITYIGLWFLTESLQITSTLPPRSTVDSGRRRYCRMELVADDDLPANVTAGMVNHDGDGATDKVAGYTIVVSVTDGDVPDDAVQPWRPG